MPQIRPRRIKQENEQYRLRVPEGKDTANGEEKPRDASLPGNVERDLRQFQTSENIAPRNQFVDLTESGGRAAVKRTAEAAAEQVDDEDLRPVSSHDLRRRYAQRLLGETEINQRLVMQVLAGTLSRPSNRR